VACLDVSDRKQGLEVCQIPIESIVLRSRLDGRSQGRGTSLPIVLPQLGTSRAKEDVKDEPTRLNMVGVFREDLPEMSHRLAQAAHQPYPCLPSIVRTSSRMLIP